MAEYLAKPPEGRFVEAGPIKMHVLEYGNPEDPAVVFLHGSGPGNCGYANFSKNAQEFADAGFYVVLPDLIGFGYTDKPIDLGDYTLDLFCDTLKAGLISLGISSCSFVGNSLGGGIAVQIALNDPNFVKKLIMMGPGCIEEQQDYFTMPGISKMVDALKDGLTEETLKKVLKNFVYDETLITPDLIAMRWYIVKDQPKEVITTMKTPNLGPRLQELTCPILTFWGADDLFMPPQGKQTCLRANNQSRLIEVNACGHWVMIEHPRMFNATGIDFLKHG